MAGLARRAFEKIAMKQAMDCGIPVNGVCAAMQSVNVDGGGDLIQHVEGHSQVDDKIPPFVPVQFVQIQPDTQLADITGATPGAYVPQRGELPPEIKPVNSIHHQAVKTVRPDFVVSAISDDGHIEGIEPKDKSIKARFVQWHPEFGDSDVGPKLAGRLYDDALAYAKSKPQQEAPEIPEGLISNKVSLGKMAAMIMQRRQNAQMQLG
jgi:putative glutamine amidotransferase